MYQKSEEVLISVFSKRELVIPFFILKKSILRRTGEVLISVPCLRGKLIILLFIEKKKTTNK